jgi:hypothetical protein
MRVRERRRQNPNYIPIVGEPDCDWRSNRNFRAVRRDRKIKELYDAGTPVSELAAQFDLKEYYIILIAKGRRGITNAQLHNHDLSTC